MFCLFSHLDNTVQVCIAEGSSGHGRLNRFSDVTGRASLVEVPVAPSVQGAAPDLWTPFTCHHPHQWVCFTVEEGTVTF